MIKKDEAGKLLAREAKFKITELYKGQTKDTINVRLLGIAGFGPGIHIGGKYVLMPDEHDNGFLSVTPCSQGLRNQKIWLPKVKKAYSTPFPALVMYLDDLALITKQMSYKTTLFTQKYKPYVMYWGPAGLLILLLIIMQLKKFLNYRKARNNGRAH